MHFLKKKSREKKTDPRFSYKCFFSTLSLQKSRKNIDIIHKRSRKHLREVLKKSKWKFKMAFAMMGGGVETGLECHIPILKNDFFETI